MLCLKGDGNWTIVDVLDWSSEQALKPRFTVVRTWLLPGQSVVVIDGVVEKPEEELDLVEDDSEGDEV